MKTISTCNETSKCPEKDYFYSKSELSQTFLLQLHRLDLALKRIFVIIPDK